MLHQTGHLIDIMATCVDISGAEFPPSSGDRTIPPLEGKSLRPIFEGRQREGHDAIFWNQQGLWRAVRKGKWKLVSSDFWNEYRPWRIDGRDRPEQQAAGDPDTLWELYDMKADRTESRDLAGQFPDRVREMADLYGAWEGRCRAATPSSG